MEPSNQVFQRKSEHIRSIPLDIILTVLTCGLFYFYIQYVQIRAVNAMLKQEKYSFAVWFLLCLVTCGLYHIYHEYVKSVEIAKMCGMQDAQTQGLIALGLTAFTLSIVTDAIQQSQINEYFLKNPS